MEKAKPRWLSMGCVRSSFVASNEVETFRAMYETWSAIPFPDEVDKAADWSGADPVVVDSEVAGRLSSVAGGCVLRSEERRELIDSIRDLDQVIASVPDAARPYFEQLKDLAVVALSVQP